LRYIVFILIYFNFLYAETLKTCYTGYYFFIPLIRDCITYNLSEGKVYAHAFSTSIGSIFKKVEYKGYSLYDKKTLNSRYFYFLQFEGKLRMIHEYKFNNNFIYFSKQIYRRKDKKYRLEKLIKRKYPLKGYLDPFTASIYLYKKIEGKKKGNLKIFYDGKGYTVPFKVIKEENIYLDGRIYKTLKIFLHPEFKTKGLLRPTGDWFLWIDKKLSIPVKMELSFTIGSFKLYIDEIKKGE